MKKPTSILCYIFAFVFCVSCSKDEDDSLKDLDVLGSWNLTTWTIDLEMDLDNNTVFNENLLDEAACANNETLIFKSNGTFTTNRSYNPSVQVSLVDGTTDMYVFDVECDVEGTIGMAGSYSQNGNIVSLLDTTGIISGNQLSIVFENAVAIYNEALTEILFTKDLTLIYQKK